MPAHFVSSSFSDNGICLPLVVIKYDSSRWDIVGVSDLDTTILVIDTSSFLYVKSIYTNENFDFENFFQDKKIPNNVRDISNLTGEFEEGKRKDSPS